MKKYELQALIGGLIAVVLAVCEDSGLIPSWLEWTLLGIAAAFLFFSFMNFNYGDETDE